MAHKLDLCPQVKLLYLERQKLVLKLARTRRYRLQMRAKARRKRLYRCVKAALRTAAPKKLVKDHRCDVPRQRKAVYLSQRDRQAVVDLKLHRT